MSNVTQLKNFGLDIAGSRHLICTEERAIASVYKSIKELRYIPENIQVLCLGQGEMLDLDFAIDYFDSVEKLIVKSTETLSSAHMGMRIYAVGSEQFVGQVKRHAFGFGMSDSEIIVCVLDHKIKRVYCSTCHKINPHVTTNIITCCGCGINLEVWSHFSRLKNAYLGVCNDAEVSNRLSETKEVEQ